MALRVYELAKELDIQSKDLIALASKMGISAKSSFSTFTDEEVAKIRSSHKSPGGGSAEEGSKLELSDGPRRMRRIISIKKDEDGVKRVRRKNAKEGEEEEEETKASPEGSAESEDAEEVAETEAVEETNEATEIQAEASEEEAREAEAEPAQKAEPPRDKSAAPVQVVDELDHRGLHKPRKAGGIRKVTSVTGADGKVQIQVVEAKGKNTTVVKGEVNAIEPTIEDEAETARRKEARRIFDEEQALKPKKAALKRDRFDAKGGAHKNLAKVDLDRDDRPIGGNKKRVTKFMTPKARREPKVKHTFQPRKKDLVVGESITIGDLAGMIGVRAPDIIKTLINLGIMATITQAIDGETAQLVAEEHGVSIKFDATTIEDSLETAQDAPEDMVLRSPVVTIMGHVDHGKTSLLDKIRKTNVTQGEAGGITQHIGAYHVNFQGGEITFLDTPGHEAFTAMRARGANATDIVILVVAADDGPRPQTVEAIHHAKAAEVPIIVAINKCDKPGANPDKVIQELMSHELVSESFGGDIVMIKVSAHSGEGIPELLEAIELQAEVMELQANPNREAAGVVIESKLEKGRGNIATVLIQNGTLKIGDNYVVGSEYGRVRAMWNDLGQPITVAGPAIPVEIVGLNGLPKAGDQFIVGSDEKQVRSIAESRAQKEKESQQAKQNQVRLENLFEDAASETKELNLIIKTDVVGSMEALSDSLAKLGNEEVAVRVIHSAVGAIARSDVMLAVASKAIVIGFNIRPDQGAKQAASEEGVEIRLYSVIYDAIEDVTKALEGMLKPIIREEIQGKAEVLEVFNIPKVGLIAGTKVTEGKFVRDSPVRVFRDHVLIHDGKLSSLKRFKENAKEVAQGFECGIGIQNFKDLRVGDILESYQRLETSATL
ncbi:MAG: translation initiation factor IF-2 [bacterium]|nr:translation initiation factor IF-2 [bacterium]